MDRMLQAEFGVDVEAFHRLSSSHAAPAGDVRGRVDRPRLLECQLTRPRPRGADTRDHPQNVPIFDGSNGAGLRAFCLRRPHEAGEASVSSLGWPRQRRSTATYLLGDGVRQRGAWPAG
jgi:hypothetical protein